MTFRSHRLTNVRLASSYNDKNVGKISRMRKNQGKGYHSGNVSCQGGAINWHTNLLNYYILLVYRESTVRLERINSYLIKKEDIIILTWDLIITSIATTAPPPPPPPHTHTLARDGKDISCLLWYLTHGRFGFC